MPTRYLKRIVMFCIIFALLPVTSVSAASVIKDPVLTNVIRSQLQLASKSEIKVSHLKKLTSIFDEDTKTKITSLQGIEHAVNMKELFLPGQNIKNIEPLRSLKKLNFIALEGNNITNLSALSGLENLENLIIDGNKIKSLAPLKNLRKLTSLLASNNQISDLNPLRKLKLQWVILSGNQIRDLTPLKNHPTLEYLYLDGNLIRDISVLQTIPHLKEVSLIDNPLNGNAERIVEKLESAGVIVTLDDTNNGELDSR